MAPEPIHSAIHWDCRLDGRDNLGKKNTARLDARHNPPTISPAFNRPTAASTTNDHRSIGTR